MYLYDQGSTSSSLGADPLLDIEDPVMGLNQVSLWKRAPLSDEISNICMQGPPRTGLIQWLDNNDHMRSRGAEFLRLIKKQASSCSGEMTEQQMEFATKLAEFEDVYEELEAEKLEAGASSLGVPNPGWLTDPRPQPHWSVAEGRLARGAPARPLKVADSLNGMIISMHPTLLAAECMSSLCAAAAAGGARLRADPAAPRSLVAFQRARDPSALQALDQCMSGGAGAGAGRGAACLRYVSVVGCSAAVQLLRRRALPRHAAALQRARPGDLTLLIHDATGYFKRGEPKELLEQAKIELQACLGVAALECRGAEPLAARLLQVARALAEEPYKLSRRAVDEEAQFYMRGDNRRGVAVDAQGNGLGRLWQQMLSVLPQSSLETSRALAALCPAPRAMAQMVGSAESAAALQAVAVARSAAPGARPRRLQRPLADTLHALFHRRGDCLLH